MNLYHDRSHIVFYLFFTDLNLPNKVHNQNINDAFKEVADGKLIIIYSHFLCQLYEYLLIRRTQDFSEVSKNLVSLDHQNNTLLK